MKKTLTAVAAAAIVAAATIAPDPAEARRGHRGGAIAAGVIGGIAAGAIIAGAGRHYGYGPYYGGYGYGHGYYAPAYYDYGPGCVIRRQRVWDGYGYRIRRVRVCY
jgi:hypothetical protein